MKKILGLDFSHFRGDLFGGLTAGIVALPLALAFGVSSGLGPSAGLYGADGEDQAFVTDEILIKNGDPAELIIETAQEQNCDLIVMGTHGHGGITDVLIGSTAKRVVRQSTIPVLVIRLP